VKEPPQNPGRFNLLKEILATEEQHADELADLFEGMPTAAD
jgi:bacterioferritin (cytochrome b1)